MAASVDKRPSQYKQKSRKGKKAWRKNIDLSDIEQSIEEKQELEITHGAPDISKLQDEKLFQVDDQGDLELKSRLIKRKQIKKSIRSQEILNAIKTNSKVEAVKHPKLNEKPKDRIQNVSKKELKKLLALAGKTIGESKLQNRIAKEGLVKSGSFDIWGPSNDAKVMTRAGIKVAIKPNSNIPSELLEKSTTGWSIPSVKPATLDRPPEKVQEYEDLPHAGKSYNPAKGDWSDLIMTEYTSEKAREDNRIAQQQYREKISHLMKVLGNNEVEEEDSSSEEENDQEQQESEPKEEFIRLSVNEAVKNKKKTKRQRNRAKKHETQVKIHEELKQLKYQLRELEKLDEIESSVREKPTEVRKPKKNKKHRLGTKYSAREANLEVKFSDELSDSLRKLKPEGNLLYDQLRKLQSTGKVETRVRVRKPRGIKPKVTEKWTYKDFK